MPVVPGVPRASLSEGCASERARRGGGTHDSWAEQRAPVWPRTLVGDHKVCSPARKTAGRGDLRWHDLRQTSAVLAAQTGATLAELMGRLGHSTPGAAMRYQHAAADRDAEIAKRLSQLVEPRDHQ